MRAYRFGKSLPMRAIGKYQFVLKLGLAKCVILNRSVPDLCWDISVVFFCATASYRPADGDLRALPPGRAC